MFHVHDSVGECGGCFDAYKSGTLVGRNAAQCSLHYHKKIVILSCKTCRLRFYYGKMLRVVKIQAVQRQVLCFSQDFGKRVSQNLANGMYVTSKVLIDKIIRFPIITENQHFGI